MFRIEACWMTVTLLALTSGPLPAQMNWIPDTGNPVDSPFVGNDVPTVIYDEDEELWKAWYSPGVTEIAYAESNDGVHWQPNPAAIVLSSTSGAAWEVGTKYAPSVIYDPENPSTVVDDDGEPYAYQMWYTARNAGGSAIGYVVSHDGKSWARPLDQPVLRTGAPGHWDQAWMHQPNVLYDADEGLYRMWYAGGSGNGPSNIGLATSENGVDWEKGPGPLALRRPGEGSTINCDVRHIGTHYEMWLTIWEGTQWGIHYARSLDGVTWTRPANSAVAIPFVGWEGIDGPCNPEVQTDGDIYRVWYTGGCNDGGSWLTGTATFEADLPRPHFRIDPEGDVLDSQPITFDASRSNSPVVADPKPGEFSYSWDFGDGEIGEGVTVEHAYKYPGDYTVRLTFSDGLRAASIERVLPVGFRSEPVPGWTSLEIGEPFGPGGARPEADCLRVLGAAGNIRGRADRFQFLHREITGDFRVTATVADWESERSGSKFGLMVREGTGAGARNVFLDVLTSALGDARLRFQRRLSEGATTSTDAIDGLEGRGPIRLRIERCGDEITASVSGDGAAWSEPRTATLEGLGGEALVGIAASSYSAGSTRDWCVATVCDLSIEALEACGPEPGFRRGDTNDDGAVNIADAQYLLNFLFLGGPTPACDEATNVNDDGQANIADAQYLLNFLFLGGPKPNAPYPDCGPDPEGGTLGCESSACE